MRSGRRGLCCCCSTATIALNEASIDQPEIDEVWTLVQALTTAQREVVVLHFYEDLGLAEIASLLGRPASTVRSDLRRALTKLKGSRTPDDVDRMYAFAASHALVDPISIALWSRHAGEFVESGGAYLARARAICTKPHETYDITAGEAESETADFTVAADILEDAVVELRSLPAPEAAGEQFDRGYTVPGHLVDSLRLLAAGPAPTTTANGPASSADQDLTNLLTQVAHLQLGLERCAINPLRGHHG